MPDEPSGELPQPPLKSLFQRWAEERVEKPRDISEEVRNEMAAKEIDEFDEKKITIEMAQTFYKMFPGEDPNGVCFLDYQNKDDPDSTLFTYRVTRKTTGEERSVIVEPHDRMTFVPEQRVFHTPAGDLPEMFIGNKGEIYMIDVKYELSEKGESKKQITLTNIGKPNNESMDNLPRAEYGSDQIKTKFTEPLNHQDYTQLKGYITLYEMGQVTVDKDWGDYD